MTDQAEEAVERVIKTIRSNLGEPLTIDDMAKAALFSKFHFSRLFQRVTGISPGRFLSAVRLAEAKKLLVNSSMNVAEISLRVGYTSVGTFSTRFTRSVGLSPTSFRRLGGHVTHIPQQPPASAGGNLRGRVTHRDGHAAGTVFLGLFPNRIPEGRPVRCTILDGPRNFRLDHVPEGTWHLLAQSVAVSPEEAVTGVFDGEGQLCVGSYGPVTVRRGEVVRANLRLHPVRSLDPPVLLALLDVRRTALDVVRAGQLAALGADHERAA
ncbi:AraC family transcriptional regulator [Micromonospora sp. NPDC050980]|uniref:helix-turn-helix transcriptional regulator n=1 Tax=Micromonospora sp. NPDC050980 TaxID=3155161 RepID=UPI00340A4686